jgi:SsrA-binding protein
MTQQNNIVIKNKKASFDYEFIETYVAGVVLTGTEIKSIRLGKAGLTDCYCLLINNELWMRNMYIAEYFYGTYNNHEARKDRKLLLNRKELNKIDTLSKNTGFTIVPTKLFLNEKGLVKIVIAIAKGKKSYDKRQSLKEKDDRRDMERAFKK